MIRQPLRRIFVAAAALPCVGLGAAACSMAAPPGLDRRPSRRAQGGDRRADADARQSSCATATAIPTRRSPSSASGPADTVVEIWPGGGWYTEILAPYVAARRRHLLCRGDGRERHGRRAPADGAPMPRSTAAIRLAAFPTFDAAETRVPDGSADVVLTFRNVHNWQMGYQREPPALCEEAFRQIFAMLRPGGTLGVVDHRLPESADAERERTSGYVKVSTVRRLAEAAGFRFVAASEVNANPRDTADWPDGVWTLPPALRLGERDRERYLAIGESDRMTLRFVKPRISAFLPCIAGAGPPKCGGGSRRRPLHHARWLLRSKSRRGLVAELVELLLELGELGLERGELGLVVSAAARLVGRGRLAAGRGGGEHLHVAPRDLGERIGGEARRPSPRGTGSGCAAAPRARPRDIAAPPTASDRRTSR